MYSSIDGTSPLPDMPDKLAAEYGEEAQYVSVPMTRTGIMREIELRERALRDISDNVPEFRPKKAYMYEQIAHLRNGLTELDERKEAAEAAKKKQEAKKKAADKKKSAGGRKRRKTQVQPPTPEVTEAEAPLAEASS